MARNATAVKAASGEPQDNTKTAETVVPPKAVTTIKSTALSTDVGPRVVAAYAKSFDDEVKANEMLKEIGSKRYDMLASMTAAIVKAVEADTTINLAAQFGKGKDKLVLSEQIGLALGLREIVVVKTAKGEHQKVEPAKSLRRYFPTKEDIKDTPEYKRKDTFRTNFSHVLTKCIQAAHGITSKGIKAKMDDKAGTLMISGPAVVEHFGRDNILVNEKITVDVGGGNSETLKVKPSFTALARIGATKEGATHTPRVDSRVSAGTVDSDTALQSICSQLIVAIGKLTKPNVESVKSLTSVRSAINNRIGNGK